MDEKRLERHTDAAKQTVERHKERLEVRKRLTRDALPKGLFTGWTPPKKAK